MKEKLIGCVSFSSSVFLKPWHRDPERYAVEIKGEILVHSDDAEEHAGELSLILVQATEACNDQVPLYQVCDAHSDLLQQIHSILMQSDSEVRDELGVEPSWSDLLVIGGAEIVEKFQGTALLAQAIETAIAAFCAGGLIVARRADLGHLTADQFERLGFVEVPYVRLAGAGDDSFVIRDNCCKHIGADDGDGPRIGNGNGRAGA